MLLPHLQTGTFWGTCRVRIRWMNSDMQGPLSYQQPTSALGSPHAGLAKPEVFSEVHCGLESLKQWFLPRRKEEEADPWTLRVFSNN